MRREMAILCWLCTCANKSVNARTGRPLRSNRLAGSCCMARDSQPPSSTSLPRHDIHAPGQACAISFQGNVLRRRHTHTDTHTHTHTHTSNDDLSLKCKYWVMALSFTISGVNIVCLTLAHVQTRMQACTHTYAHKS